MGLAASQGRYLCLTARNSDLVYEGQQISQQRLALTKETQEIADKYNEAMNNKIMQVTVPDGDTQQLTYGILTSQNPYTGLGMRVVDLNGNVVVPNNGESLSITETKDGKEVTSSISNAFEFVSLYMTDLSADEAAVMSNKPLSELAKIYDENYSTTGKTVTYVESPYASMKGEDERFLFDENCNDPKYLQEMLTTGQWLLQQAVPTEKEKGWNEITWQGSSAIAEIYDTSDDAAAESEYEAAMLEIQKKDKVLELRLEQVQTEQSSVETELDSIKQVISKNIEDSFKTFA